MDSDQILEQLSALSKSRPDLDLLQFQTLVSARQFSKLYGLITKFLPASVRVLDWGCGNGHASFALHQLGYEVTGFTLGAPPKLASFMPKATFVTNGGQDPTSLPFPDNSFDGVLSVGVLEHVRETGGDELASLKEMKRILKPGGAFICYHLPNRYSYLDAIARAIPKAHHHKYRFTHSSISALCDAAGLTVVECRRYGALPRNPWQSIAAGIRNRRSFAALWDALDFAGETIASAVVQNYYFVARAS